MFEFLDTKMTLEFFGEISIYFGIGVQIIFALILGGMVGFDREVKLKAAGLKTNIMICIGATLYTTISMLSLDGSSAMVDPNRVAAQIVSGIGFLGAGAIIQGRGSVTGLTTAATIWVVAAIGFCIGVGYPFVATLFSVTVLIILKVIHPFNKIIERKKDFQNFHVEILCFGEIRHTIDSILEPENMKILKRREENYAGDENFRVLNLYVYSHSRSLERVCSELSDSIKIKKINFFAITSIPDFVEDQDPREFRVINKV